MVRNIRWKKGLPPLDQILLCQFAYTECPGLFQLGVVSTNCQLNYEKEKSLKTNAIRPTSMDGALWRGGWTNSESEVFLFF